MPEVAQRLLQSDSEIRLLCHNADPAAMKEVQQALRALSATEPRLILDERLADDRVWAQLLDASDLIICPYTSSRFAISYSAIAVEAVDARGRAHGSLHREAASDQQAAERRLEAIVAQITDGSWAP